jgi:hypothetical protein
MKETDDRAMELLLRRQAQRNPGVSNGQDAPGAALSSHLDADEINALAENALPRAARARYFSHLADCADCRKLATELAVIAATAAGIERESAPGKSIRGSFWQMMATLFSLPVMRYGVPALTILILVVVGLVALRRPTSEFVARKDEGSAVERQATSITASPETSKYSDQKSVPKQGNEQTKANAPAATVEKRLGKEQPPAVNEKAATSGYSGAANAQQPGFAPEPNVASNDRLELFKNTQTTVVPAAPAKSEPRDAVKLADKAQLDGVTSKRSEVGQPKEEQISRRSVGPYPPPKLKALGTESKDNKGGPRRSREQSESEARSSGSLGGRSTEASVQTRNVSGRRFRREGNTWVDAAYDSSRGVIILSRNSDQYRKLVNDQPGLRAIVEELDNVIVVWNGKQYRIH